MKYFWLWFVFCAAAGVATLGVGIWGTVKVVNWLTSGDAAAQVQQINK